MSLALCLDCRRHVRIAEASCPFCGGAVGAPATKRAGRMHRGAIMFAVTVAGCSGADDSNIVPVYGAPFDSAMSETTVGDTSVTDTGARDSTITEAATDATSEVASDANDAADTEETRFLPPYGAPSDPQLV